MKIMKRHRWRGQPGAPARAPAQAVAEAPDAPGPLGRSRRGLLAGAAGALGALAAGTVAPAQPAAASNPPVLLGTDNTGATNRTGIFTTGNAEWAQLADPGNAGLGSLGVYGAGHDTGVRGEAVNGTGVIGKAGVTGGSGGGNGTGIAGLGAGTGSGVTGTGGSAGGNGVDGRAGSAAGAGVLAENNFGGTALQVSGRAAFSRSGLLTVAAGSSSGTVTGVALSTASLVLATLQQNLSGVYVRSVVPNVAGSSFTVHLSKAVTASAAVAWFVVN